MLRSCSHPIQGKTRWASAMRARTTMTKQPAPSNGSRYHVVLVLKNEAAGPSKIADTGDRARNDLINVPFTAFSPALRLMTLRAHIGAQLFHNLASRLA